jgi:hypothetical protein
MGDIDDVFKKLGERMRRVDDETLARMLLTLPAKSRARDLVQSELESRKRVGP